MKTLFTIGTGKKVSDTLLVEIGQDHCCYAFLNGQSKIFEFIKYVSFDDLEAEEKMAVILDVIKEDSFDKVIICSAFAQALLVPQNYYTKRNTLLNVIYDNPGQKHLNNTVEEWQIITTYSLPDTLHQLIISRFSSAQFFHAYTPTLKIYNGFFAADQLNIHFTTRYFRVFVKRGNEIRLAQIYSYKTPLDVIYYLLKICYEFSMNQSEAFLVVSGLIDKDSAMYAELHNYFLNLHFAQAPSYVLPENEYPHYYFTSLYNLAACAS